MALIVLCGLPLLSPHFYMIKEERKFSAQVNLDRIVNLLYVKELERLYSNENHWDKIEEGYTEPVDSELLTNSHYSGTLTVNLLSKVTEEKEDVEKEESPHHLIEMIYVFKEDGAPNSKPIKYSFKVYVERSTAQPTSTPSQQENKEDDNKAT